MSARLKSTRKILVARSHYHHHLRSEPMATWYVRIATTLALFLSATGCCVCFVWGCMYADVLLSFFVLFFLGALSGGLYLSFQVHTWFTFQKQKINGLRKSDGWRVTNRPFIHFINSFRVARATALLYLIFHVFLKFFRKQSFLRFLRLGRRYVVLCLAFVTYYFFYFLFSTGGCVGVEVYLLTWRCCC